MCPSEMVLVLKTLVNLCSFFIVKNDQKYPNKGQNSSEVYMNRGTNEIYEVNEYILKIGVIL